MVNSRLSNIIITNGQNGGDQGRGPYKFSTTQPPFLIFRTAPLCETIHAEHGSTQHAVFRVIETWKKCLDESGLMKTILIDLSKASDCIPHDLLIAKLEAYGLWLQEKFIEPSLQLPHK